MKGSYQLDSFTKNRISEVNRLRSQVDLFFEKEFEVYQTFGLINGMKIIDCGSGPGFLLQNILKKLPECEATALEVDPFLVDILQGNSVEEGKKLFDVQQGSIYDTRLPDNTYDFAISRLVIEHLQSPDDAFKELFRILKPGGKLVIVSNDFAYHLITYPVIPELAEMFNAYCRSRFSEGGNPLIGRQIPVFLKNNRFSNVRLEVIHVHSDLVGDKAMLKAESVNISKSLVSEGFLQQETLDSLAESWFRMFKDPDHVIYRQLFAVSGEKDLNAGGSGEKAGSDSVNEGQKVHIDNISELERKEQEIVLRSFLTNEICRIMMDEDLSIQGDTKLFDIDIDSIGAAELSSILKEDFNSTVSISDILQECSINDIISKILNEKF